MNSGLPRRHVAYGLAVVFVCLTPPGDSAAFQPDILDSVVSVLPDWPSKDGRAAPTEAPEGSAVAIMEGGLLATNAHVLGRARTAKVRLRDGRLVLAEIIGRDPLTDLALIRVDIDLPVPATAPVPALGDDVCAIGNQFGLGPSVTCGVVSAVRRTGTGFNPIEDFVQTDAAVNPGSSGGALVDGEGRLVGLLSAIFSKGGDANIGVNFATSIRLVRRVVEDLRDYGRVNRGKSGVRVVDLTDDERVVTAGAKVIHVNRDGAAAAAGLAPNDIIVEIDGRLIRRASDVSSAIYLRRPGDTLAISLLRDGRRLDAEMRLAP